MDLEASKSVGGFDAVLCFEEVLEVFGEGCC
jgi:hypothetical protein